MPSVEITITGRDASGPALHSARTNLQSLGQEAGMRLPGHLDRTEKAMGKAGARSLMMAGNILTSTGAFGGLGGSVGRIGAALGGTVQVMGNVQTAMAGATMASRALGAAMIALPVIGIATAVAGLVMQFLDQSEAEKKAADEADKLRESHEKLAAAQETLRKATAQAIDAQREVALASAAAGASSVRAGKARAEAMDAEAKKNQEAADAIEIQKKAELDRSAKGWTSSARRAVALAKEEDALRFKARAEEDTSRVFRGGLALQEEIEEAGKRVADTNKEIGGLETRRARIQDNLNRQVRGGSLSSEELAQANMELGEIGTKLNELEATRNSQMETLGGLTGLVGDQTKALNVTMKDFAANLSQNTVAAVADLIQKLQALEAQQRRLGVTPRAAPGGAPTATTVMEGTRKITVPTGLSSGEVFAAAIAQGASQQVASGLARATPVPGLQHGAIIEPPGGVFRVGEGKEKEIVTPLSRLMEMLRGTVGGDIVVQVVLDGEQIARHIERRGLHRTAAPFR